MRLNDPLRVVTAAAALGFLSLPTLAAAGDEKKPGWASAFADFFMGPEKREDQRWLFRLAPGATLEIKGVNGGITAEPASGPDVEVFARKRGRRDDPKRVSVELVETAGGGMVICAVYPSPDTKPNECRPGREGRMNVRNNDVVVEFALKVPEGVSFVGRTVNGTIKAERLARNVEGYTVNGGVRIACDGYARAETVNGSIHAALGKANWREPVAFKAVNGSVTVSLPNDADVDIRAETVNGGISAEFTLTNATRTSHRRLSGTLGRGGRELLAKTVNGSVRLVKTAS
jgi:hypothetical protein